MGTTSKITFLGAAVAVAMALSLHAANAGNNSEVAVSAPNFSLGAAYGVLDTDSKLILSGRATTPLYADVLALQVDGADALGEGDNRGALGLHLFTRKPSSYLLGVTTLWGMRGGVHSERYGLEGELYRNKLTLRLAGGGQHTEGNGGTGYVNGKAGYYITDNLFLSASAFGYSDSRGAGVDAEWKPSLSMPFSLFAAAGDTNDSSGYGMIGVRYSFGDNNASLIDRHRRYDPDNIADTFIGQENGGGDDECDARPRVGRPPVAALDGAGPSPCFHHPI